MYRNNSTVRNQHHSNKSMGYSADALSFKFQSSYIQRGKLITLCKQSKNAGNYSASFLKKSSNLY